jgi:hypothetical protein
MAESVDLRPLVPPQTFVAKDRTRAMIRAEIKRNNEAIERAIGTALGTLLREVEARVNALEAKINRLEAAMAEFAYKGAWELWRWHLARQRRHARKAGRQRRLGARL